MKKLGRLLFAFLGLTAGVASADVMPPPHDGARPPRIDVVNLLSLDAARAGQVEAILNGARQKMHALHEQLEWHFRHAWWCGLILGPLDLCHS